MPEFIANPAFMAQIKRAGGRAMQDVAKDLTRTARRKATWSRNVRSRVYAEVREGVGGAYIVFSTGSSLQNIAEQPKGQRRTRKGARRGVMPRKPVMAPTVAEVVPKGLPIHRHIR